MLLDGSRSIPLGDLGLGEATVRWNAFGWRLGEVGSDGVEIGGVGSDVMGIEGDETRCGGDGMGLVRGKS